jgi:SAM-dependent methyltransferase
LDRVKTCRVALDFVPVLLALAVLTKRSNTRGELFVVGDEGTCVPEGTEVLGRVEAERSRQPGRAGSDAVTRGPVRLTGILDHEDGAISGEVRDGAHVRHLPVEVDRQQEARSRAYGSCRCSGVEAVVRLPDVDEDGPASGLCNRLERGCERRSGHDDLVSRFEPGGEEGDPKRVETACDPNTVDRSAVMRERLLERCNLRPVCERALIDQFPDFPEKSRCEPGVGRAQIEERHRCLEEGGRLGLHGRRVPLGHRRVDDRKSGVSLPPRRLSARTRGPSADRADTRGACLRSYSTLSRGLGQLTREAMYLARGRSADVSDKVAEILARLEEVEQLVAERLDMKLEGMRMLDVGAGQLKVQMAYFALRNDVVGIDQDVIAGGFNLGRYFEMWRKNGPRRVAKTIGRKALLVDARYRRELASQLKVERLPALLVTQMDAGNMTFPDESFDFVYALAVFQHLESPAAVVDEMIRVLVPGGGLYLDFILYTSRTGSHDVRLLADKDAELPLWAHLRPDLQGMVQSNAYLNRVRLPDWVRMFEERMPGAQIILRQPEKEWLAPAATALQQQGELTEYSLDELLSSKVAILWRKPAEGFRFSRVTDELAERNELEAHFAEGGQNSRASIEGCGSQVPAVVEKHDRTTTCTPRDRVDDLIARVPAGVSGVDRPQRDSHPELRRYRRGSSPILSEGRPHEIGLSA